MSARKLQQEVEKVFKRVSEGIQSFEQIYEKLQHCNNASQKEKLEDSLKREIKKLQRHRDQIKTWAANSEIKDKKPLLDERKKIETQMEKFKAVEKEMKTKAYSKEGLMASTRLDPMAQKKHDLVTFLSDCTSDLDRHIEACEAEAESLSATLKKGKKDSSKADRVAEVEKQVERHKWHQAKLELIMRLLENGQLEVESVERVKDDIRFYIESWQDPDHQEYDSENIYDELDLDEENAEDLYGIGADADRMSSQETQSIQDDLSERPGSTKDSVTGGRRPSTQLKSPMPALATLHQPASSAASPYINNGLPPSNGSMKPAPIPTRPPGEALKYASVATAAVAADRNVGIAPLPPPPGMAAQASAASSSLGMSPLPPPNAPKQPSQRQGSCSGSLPTPVLATSPPDRCQAAVPHTPSIETAITAAPSPKPSNASTAPPISPRNQQEPAKHEELAHTKNLRNAPTSEPEASRSIPESSPSPLPESQTNGTNGSSMPSIASPGPELSPPPTEESVYYLPPGLQDLMSSFENTKKRLLPQPGSLHRSLEISMVSAPDTIDAEKPRHYKPTTKYNTPTHYPQEPLPVFDDPSLYKRIDVDTLFYVFYYRQGTYQQYLAAKELKRQSWRFHKQYQTWFQRHEEPKTITEEFEQGTYRFFDYESTWSVSL
ncbi:hypothetical protein C7212DRAFT_348777 [Tuber magnatum]|uniref:General negative regulator of transcription subunit n=1 Tax=Tuber magnatum TaxID=42249 RepID=A0A317SDM2_9PEZI|nr:hypothetical protein C7212DRAFT_348777 [Tuber magnatum]